MTTAKQTIDFIQTAITAINTEQRALDLLIEQLDERFVAACQTILACQGRVVVTGMGKSGHIGRKIAATFASTGTPAFFMHPGEAGHGDLGMLVAGDVLIAISNSGESDEIRMLLPVVKQLGIPMISISRDTRGVLPRAADIALTLGLSEEACPLGLAPTSSTTATLALGDALAVVLLHARGFTSDDFALSHPAGALGRKLLTRVQDVMHTDNLPVVHKQTSLHETLLVMTHGRLGLAVVVDESDRVLGIFTDGDLRRKLAENQDLTVAIADLMTIMPKTIDGQMRASDALTLMNQHAISQLLVVEADKLVGVISIHDLLKAGVS
ncbi:arabinose-5-phosphate isomerase [Moraxella cuniculi DSM 21768]|uniref:Arabinose 5-phosphate isomerase n=1 Tax=Moraxella cuniculi DSM 21768 TaxID=1122245 RepID=A0A1N7FJR4_9GAMM|nr:KpsF/GutQ family sugar-phosphate isomerase [Moraxella cuniculi]OOS02232.1 D-arabinose 5-phosphate isomerase [Moraxella cuniculi]SIS00527.1 arabinose-5-phosphate isomerase [Moraxella cuniculi DSM 21768]